MNISSVKDCYGCGVCAASCPHKIIKYVGDKIGPLEFLKLMENASFVITTSFHGTAFATIFHKPLLSVVQDTESEDGRMQTLLRDCSRRSL